MSEVMFSVIPVVMVVIFILVFGFAVFNMVRMISPKGRAKMLSRQMSALKQATDMMAPDLKDLAGNVANIQKEIYDKHGDTLRDVARMGAEIEAEGTRAKAQAIKDVFGSDVKMPNSSTTTSQSKTNKVVCQNCGSLIDADSMYCKVCGKRPF